MGERYVVAGEFVAGLYVYPNIWVERSANLSFNVMTKSQSGKLTLVATFEDAPIVQVSQVSIDRNLCQETISIEVLLAFDVEPIGDPIDHPSSGATWSVEASYNRSENGGGKRAILAAQRSPLSEYPDQSRLMSGSGTAWFQITYKDPPGLAVASTRSTTQWSWSSAGCVQSYSGYGTPDFLWQTFWQNPIFVGASAHFGSCSNGWQWAKIGSTATYTNDFFCWPGHVEVQMNNVHIVGYGNGTWAGGADGLSATDPPLCPDLHWVQTYGGP